MINLYYLDTSAVVAALFKESGFEKWLEVFNRNETLFTSAVIEAELQAYFKREEIIYDEQQDFMIKLQLVYPNQLINQQLKEIFSISNCKGVNALHLATALWLAGKDRKQLSFITADKNQAQIAKKLGFNMPLN